MAFCIGTTAFDTYRGIDPNLQKLRIEQEEKKFKKKHKNNFNYKNIAIEKRRIIIQTHYHLHDDCPICLNNMFNQRVKYLPCGHVVCSGCLEQQIQSSCASKFKCACCRYDFIENLPISITIPQVINDENSVINYLDYNNIILSVFQNYPNFDNNTNIDVDNNTNIVNRLLSSISNLCIIIQHELNNISESDLNNHIDAVINNAREYNNIMRNFDGGYLVINILESFNIPNSIINNIINKFNDRIIDDLAISQD